MVSVRVSSMVRLVLTLSPVLVMYVCFKTSESCLSGKVRIWLMLYLLTFYICSIVVGPTIWIHSVWLDLKVGFEVGAFGSGSVQFSSFLSILSGSSDCGHITWR